MTIIFENDNDIIVYALEKIISYARNSQQIFVAQCVWWLALIIGLEQGLVNYIDNIQSRSEISIIPEEVPDIKEFISPEPRDTQEDERRNRVLKGCEQFLMNSKRLRGVAKLKSSGKTKLGQINPLKASRKSLRVAKEEASRDNSKTVGIDQCEIKRRKSTGEC
jgi:hypothetical protein